MRTVIGVFDDEPYAEEAIAELQKRGFSPEDLSVIMKDRTIDAGTEMRKDVGGGVAKGTTSGIATGAVVGGIAGLLVGIGAFAIPGVGAFLVGGPLAAALGLTGAAASTVTGAATGAVAGGLIGALMGLGLTKEEAAAYEERIKAGALLMAVPALAEQEEEVVRILERFNATDITSVAVPTDRVRTTGRHYATEERDIDYSDRDMDYRDEDYETTTDYPSRSHAIMGTKGGRSAIHRDRRDFRDEQRRRTRRRRRIF